MKQKNVHVRIPEGLAKPVRVDTFIADTINLITRSQIKKRIVKLLVNGKKAKLSKRVQAGDLIELEYRDQPEPYLQPEAIDLHIIFEDENVIVVNKAQGIVVHPGCGNKSGTLANALIHYCSNLRIEFEDDTVRPGIVHRLDKDTSGVIIAAKNIGAQDFLAAQFRNRRAAKQYLAIVKGCPPESGKIKTRIFRDPHNRKRFTCSVEGSRGKIAVTYYKTLKVLSGFTLLSLRPKTGRTHQLRVHMLHLGYPILGDPIYSRKDSSTDSLMLHAYRLKILLPGEQEPRIFKAPLPERFKPYLQKAKT